MSNSRRGNVNKICWPTSKNLADFIVKNRTCSMLDDFIGRQDWPILSIVCDAVYKAVIYRTLTEWEQDKASIKNRLLMCVGYDEEWWNQHNYALK